MSRAEAQWEFYPTVVEGAPALFLVDLSLVEPAPLEGKSELVRCSVALSNGGGNDGVGDDDEAEKLFGLEEALTRAVEPRGGVFVGHVRHAGRWQIVFYGPAGIGRAVANATKTFVDPTGRGVEVETDDDAEWAFYFEYLLPDPERYQWIQDRDTVTALAEEGDTLTAPRAVDHFLRFSDEASRDAFLRAATEAGFQTGDAAGAHAAEDPDEELPIVAHIVHESSVELEVIHDVVMTLSELADPHRGEYDTWQAEVIEA